MTSVISRIIEKSDRIVAFIVLVTVVFALKPIVAVASDDVPSQKQKATQEVISKTPPKASDKINFSIRFDEKNGVEIKGLDELKKRLEGLKDLKSLEALDSLKALENVDKNVDFEKIEKEIQTSLKGIDKIDVQFSGDVADKDIKKLEKVVDQALRFSTPGYVMISTAPFIFAFAVIFMVFYFRARSRKEALATIRLMVEKGQPVPPDLLATLTGVNHNSSVAGATLSSGTSKSFLLSGLKPIFWGIGIILFFIFNRLDSGPWFIGMIFILVGLYHMTKTYLISETQNQKAVNDVQSSDDKTKTDKI